jgi:peptide/nickel transport system substrate-binding protein
LALVAASCGSDDNGSSGTTAAPDGTTAGSGTSGGSTTTAAPDYDPAGVLRIATSQFNNLDMVLDQGATPYGSVQHFAMQQYTLGSLFSLDADGTPIPYLAESFKAVDDSTANVILRKGLTFQDGTPYDAPTIADIIMTKYKPLEKGATFSSSILRDITSVTAPDATTLTFTLDRPVIGLLPYSLSAGLLGIFVSPASTPDPAHLIGAGPYKIKEYVKDNRVVADKWDGFFDAKTYQLAEIQWLNIPTIEAAQNALAGGQVDLIATNPRDADSVAAQGDFAVATTNNQGSYMLAFCGNAAPWSDPKFREAFDLALNREQINQVALGGKAEPSSSLWPKASKYAVPDAIDTDGDPAKAKQDLADIGWDPNKVIPLGVFPGFQTHQLIMEVIQQQLAAVGIKAQIATVEGGDFTKFTNATTGGVHLVGNTNLGITAFQVPGATTTQSVFNPCSVSNPDLAALISEMAKATTSQDVLTADWKKASQIVGSQRPWIQLMTQPAVYVYNKKVQGLKSGTITVTGSTTPQPYLEGVSIKKA